MKKTTLLLALVMGTGPVSAQFLDGQAPLVTANTYLDLADAGGRIVAVGDRGKILYSDDQGEHWKVSVTPTEVLLTSVCFADARHGWAVGHDAVVLGTDDGGETWALEYSDALMDEPQADDADAELDDLSMDDIYGDPYGDDIYGESEGSGSLDTSGAPLLDVHCESRDRAVAVGGYGYFLQTRDGGNSWHKQTDALANGDGWHLYGIAGAAQTEVRYVVGEKGVIFQSLDQGESWTKLRSPYAGTLFGVTPLSDYQVLTYGLQGNIWLSGNRGQSWSAVQSGITQGIHGGAVLSDGTVVLVASAGAILTSHDGGQSFSLRFLPGRESLSAVLPLEAGGVIVAGEGGLRVINDVK